MTNKVPFSALQDAIDDHQLALIAICNEADIIDRLADIAKKYSLPLSDAMRMSAQTIAEEAHVAVGAGERMYKEHKRMVAEVRRMRKNG